MNAGAVQRPQAAVLEFDVDAGGLPGAGVGQAGGAQFGALFAIEHVVAGYLVLPGTHQNQFHLVLDVFDMNGPA